jgi:hypothetical protein
MAVTVTIVDNVEFDAGDFAAIVEGLSVQGNAATQGVLPSAPGLNTLAVSGTSTPVSVASGWMLLKGYLVKNSAAMTVAVPTPSGSTRIDRIIARLALDGSPVTADIVRLAGAEGGSAPSLTQTTSTYELSLAQASITTGGTITVTDERGYMGDATRTMFVVPSSVYNSTDNTWVPFYPPHAFEDSHLYMGYGVFRIPEQANLAGAVTVYPIFQGETGNAYVASEAAYGKIGGDWDGHLVGNISSFAAKACTHNQIIKGTGLVITTPEAGDYVNVSFGRNAVPADDTATGDLYFIGWIVEYTGRP